MIRVIQGDITKISGFDAIVNPANNSLLGGGGLDGMIHRAAGPQLKTECRRLNGCETGDSKLTLGYNLPCKYVIHSVGPVWMGGMAGEEDLLSSCYASAMQTALDNDIHKIAFSPISTGEYGYPLDKAAKVAISTVFSFIAKYPDSFKDIAFVLSDDLSFNEFNEALKNATPITVEEKKKPQKKSKAKAKSSKAAEVDDSSVYNIVSDGETQNTSDDALSTLEAAIISLPSKVDIPPVFQNAPYNKYHIDWLIDEVANGIPHTYVCFYLAEKSSDYCEFSLWYNGAPIFINGKCYTSAIQYILSQKALLFNDLNSYIKIMNESDPAVCEKFGDNIENFDDTVWKMSYREILFNANVGKFLSDKKFADALMATKDAVIINSSPSDDIYGTGILKEDLLTESGSLKIPPQNWHKEDSDFQAKNELGFVLMSVRDYYS